MTTADEAKAMIPEKVYEMYRMDADEKRLWIFRPACISIEYDEKFDVTTVNDYVMISNKKVNVQLWTEREDMDICIF